jgi:hypothetical protein
MIWFWGAIALITAYIVLVVTCRGKLILYKLESIGQVIGKCLVPWTLHGWNGHRVFVFHRESGVMVQVIKTLSRNWLDADVNLRVRKTRLSDVASYDFERGWRVPLRHCSQFSPLSVSFKQLPPQDAGTLVKEVDCGSSLAAMQDAVIRMIAGDSSIPQDAVFHVWTNGKGGSTYVLGGFADMGDIR